MLIGQYWPLVHTSHILILSYPYPYPYPYKYLYQYHSTRQHHPVTATALHHNICTIPELLEVYHTFHISNSFHAMCQAPFCHFPPSTWAQFSHFIREESFYAQCCPTPSRIAGEHSSLHLPSHRNSQYWRDRPGAVWRCVPRLYPVLAHTEGKKNKGY